MIDNNDKKEDDVIIIDKKDIKKRKKEHKDTIKKDEVKGLKIEKGTVIINFD